MKRMMFLFVLALCMAGCTAQTRIERVHLPAPPADGVSAETNLPEREEEAYPDAQSISSPTKRSGRRWSWGRRTQNRNHCPVPYAAGRWLPSRRSSWANGVRSAPKPARRSGWAVCTPSRSEASSAMTAVKIAVRSRAGISFSSATRDALPAMICGKGLAI